MGGGGGGGGKEEGEGGKEEGRGGRKGEGGGRKDVGGRRGEGGTGCLISAIMTFPPLTVNYQVLANFQHKFSFLSFNCIRRFQLCF